MNGLLTDRSDGFDPDLFSIDGKEKKINVAIGDGMHWLNFNQKTL